MSAGDIRDHILLPMQTDPKNLHKRALQCRMLAATALTDDGRRVLLQMAEYYEGVAGRDASLGPSPSRPFHDEDVA
jgi:hypothetical protein